MNIRKQIGEISGTAFTNAFVVVCCGLFPSIYNMRWRGLENYRAAPSTLITVSHKRDTDLVVLGTWMHFKRTIFHNHRRMHFIAREDMFQPGFVNYHFKFRLLQGPIINRFNVAPFIRGLRCHPISHIVHKRVAPMMRDILDIAGDIELSNVVNQTCLEEFAAQMQGITANELAKTSISDFLGNKFRVLHDLTSDAGILKNGLSHKLREQCLARIRRQLDVFANILDGGGICMVAPEGDLSPDGSFANVKSGIYRLISHCKNSVIIQPVNMTYDFMTKKRMTVYVDVGQELPANNFPGKNQLDENVQRAIINQGRITMGHLGSEYFMKKLNSDDNELDLKELRQVITARIQTLKTSGMKFDERLMDEYSFEKRFFDFKNYCLDKKILVNHNHDSFVINDTIRTAHGDFRRNPVKYSYNELTDLLQFKP